MTPPRTPHFGRKLTRVVGSLLFAGALAACSTSGGSDASDTTTTVPKSTSTDVTTSVPGPPTTTSEPGRTTQPEPEPGSLTVADLETILPTEDEVGIGFVEVAADEDDSSDPALDAALLEACPDAAAFLDSNDDDRPSADRDFEAEDGRTFGVSLSPSPRNFDEETFPKVVDAMNSCGTVTYTASNDAEVELTLSAERIDDLGDRGVLVQMDITIDHESLDAPVSFTQGGWIYVQSGIGVSVNTADGIGDGGSVVPADYEAVGDVAVQLSNDLHRLTEG